MSFHKANDHQNVGIINFFRQKIIFVTGSTGFMGKVFVEKLLRALPSIQKIYLLVRANNAEAAKLRIKTEIIDSKLFKVLRDQHGQSYEEFMWNKLVPIVGDLCKPDMGMDTDSADEVKNEVNVIVHISANTNWYDRYDVLLQSNVSALAKFVDFALDCTKLALFVQVSSAYASQDIFGVALEKPTDWGRYYEVEDEQNKELLFDKVINTEMKMVSELSRQFHDEDEQTVEMKKLGMRRAKFYKMINCYALAKAMGETLVNKLTGKLPVVIIRPSLIESTIKEPFPGWIEGYKTLDPIILSYGTGKLQGFVANPYTDLDVVPVDMLNNAMIAAMAKHGNEGKHGLTIYNVTSSLQNPMLCHDFFDFSTNYFALNPLKDSNEKDIIVKDVKFFESMSEFTIIVGANAKLQNKFLRMVAIYEGLLTTALWFDDKNTRNLLGEMSLEELDMFNFNFKCIDWKDYFTNIHIPGLTQHVFKKKSLAAKL